MSAGVSCTAPKTHRGKWAVIARQGNRSAFNGYRWTPSAYSAIRCGECGGVWRTKANYVNTLPDAPVDWFTDIPEGQRTETSSSQGGR